MEPSLRDDVDPVRRALLTAAAAFGAAGAAGPTLAAAASAPGGLPRAGAPARPYHILFILTDQERHFRAGELPLDYRLPGHERLARRGVVFENHRINSCVCTPSRSVLYTGRHIQHTRMFDNTNFPWIGSLSPELRTIGHRLRDAGYYTAYKGKWHLTKEFETVNELGSPTRIFTAEMEAYGFGDYVGVGDIIAHDRGGYLHDGITAAMSVSWLRGRGKDLDAQGKPWFLAVNLVNPHDVMFLNTDRPGEPSQARNMLGQIRAEPADPRYSRRWRFALPASFGQALDAAGRPAAHADYMRSHDGLVGRIDEHEPWRWQRRHDYYLNCLRDADRHIVTLLDELDALGLASNTIVVLTADHGELDGAHRLHGKGATSYREQNQVPLIVAHPGLPGRARCQAVTTHLDIAPTLLGLATGGVAPGAAIVEDLPGKDLSPLLRTPRAAGHTTLREGALYCYNMLAYIDGEFMAKAVGLMTQPDGKAKVQAAVKEGALRPDLGKRGAIRSVFDGRYQFTRYFSPRQHHRPTTLETLFAMNDVELYDLEKDPHELLNLALDRRRHGELLLAMNAKLNRLIDAEVGEDVGQMLPGGVDGGWVATEAVRDV